LISYPIKNWLCVAKPNYHAKRDVIFGNLAIMAVETAVDPWLCVAGFRRLCLYRMIFHITGKSGDPFA